MNLKRPLVKVLLKRNTGNLEITDITSVTTTNGEGDRNSSVQIEFYPTDEITKALFSQAIADGGIAIPENLLLAEEEESEEGGNFTSGVGSGLLNVSGDYEVPQAGTKGDALAVAIIKYARAVGVTDNSHIASILGNIQIETNMGVHNSEIGGSNTRYAPYYGRGLIQITWENNYRRFGNFFGVDFVSNPELVKDYKYSIPIAVGGMTGVGGSPTFTGKKLSDYGSGDRFDFVNARRTVNGTDKAQLVASESKRWLARIPTLSGTAIKSEPIAGIYADTKDKQTPLSPGVDGQTTIGDIPSTAIEILVEIGWSDSNETTTSLYWYTGFSTNNSRPTTTTINGAGIRSFLSNTQRGVYNNISLRQLSNRITSDNGIEAEIKENEDSDTQTLDRNQEVKQSDETDYQILLRTAKNNGFDITEKANKLVLSSIKNVERITYKTTWDAEINTNVTAAADREIGSLPAIDSLVDGEKIGEGFSTSLTIPYPDNDALKIEPGKILNIPVASIRNLPKDSEFFREWKIKAVNTNFDGNLNVSLDLYLPVNIKQPLTSPEEDNGTPGLNSSNSTGTNEDLVSSVEKEVDKDFLPEKSESSVDFVRQYLTKSNHPKANAVTANPADGYSTKLNLANSLSGEDLGTKIESIEDLISGDIVHFRNTYGNFPKGTLTHIGVVGSDGNIIHSIDGKVMKTDINSTFPGKFTHAIRLAEN